MQCQSCQAKATIFYTQSINGTESKMSLCESCAEEQGIGAPAQALEKLNDLSEADNGEGSPFDLLAESDLTGAESSNPSESAASCPTCGFTGEDFRKVGRLGCPACYLAFDEELKPRLTRLHKEGEHKGHIPIGLGNHFKKERALKLLQEKLNQAVSTEDYESASDLNRQIEELKSSLEALSESPK